MTGAQESAKATSAISTRRFCVLILPFLIFAATNSEGCSQDSGPNSEVEATTTSLPDPHAFNPLGATAPTPYWFGYSSPVRATIYAGETYAEPDSFLSLEMLKPLRSWRFSGGSEQIQYVDARLGINFNGGVLTNLGFGRRHFFAADNAIFDANVWYDFDETGTHITTKVVIGNVGRPTILEPKET